jgi:hypothetical protein
MTGKRGAAYYRARLRRDHPTIFADLSSGKFVSVREAAAAAGLIHLPSRLDALKREWRGASGAQHVEFLKWLKAGALKRVGRPIAELMGGSDPMYGPFCRTGSKATDPSRAGL